MSVTTMQELAGIVRERRRRLGFSQAELARRASVSRKWISDLEGGKESVQMQPVLRVIRALDLDLDLETSASGDEVAVDDDGIDDRIRARARSTSFGGRLAQLGITTVALDDAGALVEHHPDGTTVVVG